MKARPFHNDDQQLVGYVLQCPGCGSRHLIHTTGRNTNKIKWETNNDTEKPTFSPSVKVTWKFGSETHICHFFVREGVIDFCGDSTHHLAGMKVVLPDVAD